MTINKFFFIINSNCVYVILTKLTQNITQKIPQRTSLAENLHTNCQQIRASKRSIDAFFFKQIQRKHHQTLLHPRPIHSYQNIGMDQSQKSNIFHNFIQQIDFQFSLKCAKKAPPYTFVQSTFFQEGRHWVLDPHEIYQ